VKVLLLGSAESGKSTFVKQMNIIHGRGEFTEEETINYRLIIYKNCVMAMRVLIEARQKLGVA
jgi:predicted kinase